MPPALIYRKQDMAVEEIVLKGMPLGAVSDFPYQLKETTINPGDTLLLQSDGLPELFNEKKEMFSYERVVQEFSKVAHKSPEDIIEELKTANKRALEVGLKTLVFAANTNELKEFLSLKPTFIAYEPPELVGSKTTSVAKAKPEVISQAVEISKEKGVPLIVGAGIKSGQDVKKSIDLGATGFAVASSIVTADDPKEQLLDLVEGFK